MQAVTYSPALMDFIVMVKGTGQMFIAGPEVMAATGETISPRSLAVRTRAGSKAGTSISSPR